MGRIGKASNKKKSAVAAGHTDARQHYGFHRVAVPPAKGPSRRSASNKMNYDSEPPTVTKVVPFEALNAVFDDDELLGSIISALMQNGATSKSDCAVLAPLLQVSKAWKEAIAAVRNQLRYDYLKKVLQSYCTGQTPDGTRLLEICYLPPQTDASNECILNFLDIGYPEGVLLMKRTSTNLEIVNFARTPIGRDCEMSAYKWQGSKAQKYMVDSGQWDAYIPHFQLSHFHRTINTVSYDKHPRLLRYQEGGIEECIGIGEYVPLKRDEIRKITNRATPSELVQSDWSDHFLFKLEHIKDDDPCAKFIGEILLHAFAQRPARSSSLFQANVVQFVQPTVFLSFPSRAGRFVFSDEELSQASSYLHEFQGFRRFTDATIASHDNNSAIAHVVTWLAASASPCIDSFSKIFHETQISASDMNILQGGKAVEDLSSNLICFFMSW